MLILSSHPTYSRYHVRLQPFLIEEGMLVKNLRASKLKRMANTFIAKTSAASSTQRIRRHELRKKPTQDGDDDFLFLERRVIAKRTATVLTSEPVNVSTWIQQRGRVAEAQAGPSSAIQGLLVPPMILCRR